MINNPFNRQRQSPTFQGNPPLQQVGGQSPDIFQQESKKFDPSRFSGLSMDAPSGTLTQAPTQAGADAMKAPSKLASGLGGALGAVSQALSQPQQEEPMPQMDWMPNQGVIGKSSFQAPDLPQLQSGLGQSALL